MCLLQGKYMAGGGEHADPLWEVYRLEKLEDNKGNLDDIDFELAH